MASVIDSCKDILGEPLSFFKVAFLTVPVYFSYQVYIGVKNNDYFGFWILGGITIFLLFGFIAEITNNVINERNIILPFNPFLVLFSSVKSFIALLPVIFISSWIAIYLNSLININLWFDNVLKTIIWLTAASFIGTTFLMFAARKNIIDAFNIKILFQKSGDFIIASIFYIIQFFFVNLITSGFIGYTIFMLFGPCVFFDIFIAYVITFNVAALGHFLGQAYYELIGYGNSKN